MRNRAKCKLCNEIIESFHQSDFVECKCKEISLDGGQYRFLCAAKDWKNFLRIDDAGNEREIIVKEKEIEELEVIKPLSKKEQIEMLKTMVKNIENLPQNAMSQPINHYDFYSYMALVVSILQENC